MALDISSPVFKNGEYIPVRYTADGRNISPALTWSGVPHETSSLALVVHDPDASRPGGFTHWVIFNLPVALEGLPEGMPPLARLETGASHGKNDGHGIGYMGPAPPLGKPHHYHFILYALDQRITLLAGAFREHLLKAMEGHVLAQAELVGLYQR